MSELQIPMMQGPPATAAEWEAVYGSTSIESMPWFYDAIDPDVDRALTRLGLSSGRLLDLGTGPGTQAIELSKRGFDVTGSDISPRALEKAKARAAAAGASVTFCQDDILDSKLPGPFEIVLDRGCFHVFAPERRPDYLRAISSTVAPGGKLLLKTFSSKEPPGRGPHRFTPEMIRANFESAFEILSIDETIYFGTRQPPPIALFSVLVRRAA